MDLFELRLGGGRCVEFTSEEIHAVMMVMYNDSEAKIPDELKSAWDKLMKLYLASVLFQGAVKVNY